MVNTELKVRCLVGPTYQVVKYYLSQDEYYKYEDEEILYQGSLVNCEAYLKFTEAGLLE